MKKLHPAAIVPTVAHPGEDLAYDLYALEDVNLHPGVATKIPTGIAAQFSSYFPAVRYGLLIRDRSSMAVKGTMVSGGVIDAGYTGEIAVVMTNMRQDGTWIRIQKGDKVAQMIPMQVLTMAKVMEVEELNGDRGDKGYGSSGR